ncbi:aminotransferase class I/II-fold pyridoxal phosphate-dependent enzyme [Arthrobacter wenxiniae]|jgi:8-amino-7-oxononanoate synthase|uniref:8-amino-7-oxononanoate synthase n=1 Tax=Arthrobacter wenxiniae TaxID=2713570 RepID=A0A7Y7IJ00_9MICC|nr:aminotransferase class I/II-fold pyridoxal phosphate-dependent enzyme [Arthrobacter wenxiniae]NVM96344.1 aminotransferase class I/II-fold pyridoxal phosphate-dependent enzyme [Arthrobacter wenxiniae]
MDAWLASRAAVRARRGLVRGTELPPRLIDLASNDYLGLSADPRVIAAAARALSEHGAGARASRVVCGTTSAHLDLERRLCLLTGQDAALAFSSGYTANLGVLAALGGPGTLMVHDAHVHASLLDGIRLSRSPSVSVAHQDTAGIRAALAGRTQPRAVVVLESIYSVLGDAAPLAEAAALCGEYDALLLVDEAHGIGVAGAGRGAVHAAGLAGAAHVAVTATLSKALGSQGGAVLGSQLLREHLANTARTFIFDTALAPSAAAAAAEAARIVLAEPALARRVLGNAAALAQRCGTVAAAGAVQSIPVGTADRAASLAAGLRHAGVAVGCFRPPSVPDGVSRLRLTARANLSDGELDRAAAAVARAVGAA